ncbi:GNAT family N-acetyltransferase [bacterium]|nr:GNAT family N-acetyltransferase [bacterium]MBU1993514.1 GNAT family N-acetyltransferase [bacterium]
MYNYEWDRLRTWLEQYGAMQGDIESAQDIVRLDLSGHSLKSIPENIAILSNLIVLNLSNNKLESLPKSFAKLSNLSNLDLRRNRFQELPSVLGALSLKSLNISSNQISDIAILKECDALRVLDLSNNLIKEINLVLPHANNMRSLNLSNNFLREMSDFFPSLIHLQRLNLNTNLIMKIPSCISKMRSLKELEISDNHLETLADSFFELDLESLNLTANRLKILHLKSLHSLESITLDENSFEQLTLKENFAPHLKEFSCESCSLKKFLLPPSVHVENICFSSNEISEIPREIEKYAQLKQLDIEGNQIAELPDTLANLPSLETLYVKGNPLSEEAKKIIMILDPEICDLNMKTGISIEQAKEEDLSQMAELLSVLFAIETDFMIDYKKQYAGIKRLFEHESSDLLVAKYENKVVGMLTMQRLISSAEGDYVGQIEDLVVYEQYRKMGVGSRLINKMRNLAHEHGYKRIQLAADVNNQNAQQFYNRRGFNKTHLSIYHYFI